MFSQPAVRHTAHTHVPAVLCNYGVILLLCTKKNLAMKSPTGLLLT